MRNPKSELIGEKIIPGTQSTVPTISWYVSLTNSFGAVAAPMVS